MPHWTYRQVEDVCWAVAARDCAIEQGDAAAAALFAQQARDAIADVLATGTTLDELAYQLDYPGGAAEIDGRHIDHHIATCHDPSPEPDLETVDRDEAGRRVADTLGCDPDTARALVTRYLDDTSRVAGVPVYHWGLDQADVHAIADRYAPFTTARTAAQQDARAHEVADRAAASSRSAAADDSDWREW